MKAKCGVQAGVGALLILANAAAGAAESAPVLVDSDLRSAHWSTAFTNVIPLAWDWNGNAASSRLDIAGMGGTFVTNFAAGVSNCLWRAFASDVPSNEDVYDLRLTVYSTGGTAAGVMTARLAVVKGAFGAAAVNAVPNSPAWTRVRTDVVIPYDASWAEGGERAEYSRLLITKAGGIVQSNAFENVAGYGGWKIRNSGCGYGTFDLALSFPAATNVCLAELVRAMDGTAICVR